MNFDEPAKRPVPFCDPLDIEAMVQSPDRLEAVRRWGLLDTAPEEAFDSLTRLASRLLAAHASFISVVDDKRDFYKSQAGFPVDMAEARQLSGRTFCHYSLGNETPLVIEDTHSDPSWKAVPTVTSLGVRAYVGVPLQVDGQNIGSFCVIDTKPRAWTEEELEYVRQLAWSAAREFNLRAALATSDAALQAANAVARSQGETVAVVAHDLRTPLQVLQLGTLLLQRATQGQHDKTTTRMLSAIEVMQTMVESLLSANSVLAPSVSGRQSIAASSLAADAVNMMAPIAERSDIALSLGDLPDAVVTVDYPQMLRVLGNLIGNSLKYSPQGSAVVVSGRRHGDTVSLTVTDNGKGMDEAEKARAFERGWQGGEGMKLGDGAGLGLAIVQALVAGHGGRLSLQSAVGVGTAVSVLLPCK